MSETEQLRRSWVANASAWCEAVREQRIESRRLVTDAAIVQSVLDQQPRSVLDLGCGEGWLSRALASHGIAVTGVDASAPLIEAAQALGGATFILASYEDLIADPALLLASFDAIVANFSLLDDRVGELLAALPDGKVLVQTVHPGFASADGWQLETFDSFTGEWSASMPWYFRTLESWKRVFADAGRELVEIREPMHPHGGVPASIVFVTSPRTSSR